MQDRMAEIGGTCEVSQAPGGGGRIVFKVRFHPDPPVPSRPPPAGPDRNS
jgi:hypothetical protein